MRSPRFQTLIEMLQTRARRQPEKAAFLFDGRTTTFDHLWTSTGRFAALAPRRGLVPGGRAVLALPNGGRFFTAFYGVQRAGGVAVPVFPDSGAERVLGLANLCGARMIVVSEAMPEAKRRRLDRLGEAAGIAVVDVAESDSLSVPAELPRVRPGDLSYLQYTSGSTGDPKGVRITHAMALTNVEQLIAGMGISEREVFVSWLPAYHDMGLVLMTMVPFCLAAKLVLLPASLTHVRRWLEAIERHRATFTAAPDFAYRLCLRRIRDPRAFDLSSLRVALDAAEPVRRQTVAELESAFGLSGVVAPGYGLAEATVGVSMSPPGRPIKVDERGFVSVGRPFPGVDVAIVRAGGERGDRLAAPGEVGEIVVRSPANTSGYFGNPRATAELFWCGAGCATEGHADLRTGDLGYLDAEGELFVVGRRKNIIIHGGRNVAPGEIEEIVDRVRGVRASAAIGIDRGRLEGEQVYVFAEIRRPRSAAREESQATAVEIVAAIHSGLGFRPGRVYLVEPRTVPRTENGKIRHAALKERYLDGSLRGEGRILFPDY